MKDKLLPTSKYTYDVRDDFPSITKVPPAIHEVTYVISTAQIGKFLLEENLIELIKK